MRSRLELTGHLSPPSLGLGFEFWLELFRALDRVPLVDVTLNRLPIAFSMSWQRRSRRWTKKASKSSSRSAGAEIR